jgi:DNA polymerase-1
MEVGDLIALKGKTFSIDTETTGLRWWQDGLIGVGVHCPELGINEYIYTCEYLEVPYGKPKSKLAWLGDYEINPATGRQRKAWTRVETVPSRTEAVPIPRMREQVRKVMTEVCSDPKTVMVMHNAKFDLHFMDLDLYNLPCTLMDTSVMVHLYDSRLKKALDAAERTFLGTNSKRKHVIASSTKHKEPKLWEPERIADYCVNDCVVTYQLAEKLMPEMRSLRVNKLFWIQMKYIKTLWQIERRGIMLDPEFCHRAMNKFSENLVGMEGDFKEAVGRTAPDDNFNWKSAQQLSKAIYDGLGIPKPKNPFAGADGVDRSRHAHGGKYQSTCTSSFILMEKIDHPLGGQIMEMRETDKLRKAVETYLDLMDATGAVHSSFNITGTKTGRLSSSKPNLQNVASSHRVRETQSTYTGGSIREEEYNLRQAFVARPGYTLVSCDHAQQEIRLFAILAEEPYMIQALKDRLDIHLMIAKKVWGDCGPVQNKLHREWSKTLAFGMIYGMTGGSLKYRLNKTDEETQEITETYWGAFPRIQPFLEEVIVRCKRHKRVRYWSGRIWKEEIEEDMYVGVNAQIQGGAADLIQLAVLRAQEFLNYQGWGGVVSIIHDEMLCEVKDEYVEQAVPILLKIMELYGLFEGIPFRAEAKVGKSYGTLEEVHPEPDISNVDWKAYCRPDLKLEEVSLVPWEAGRV